MMGLRSFLSLFDATVPLVKSKAWTIGKIVKTEGMLSKATHGNFARAYQKSVQS